MPLLTHRFSARLNPLLEEFLVVCPGCQHPALIRGTHEVSLTCTHCGNIETCIPGTKGFKSLWWDSVDPYFRHPLWLQTECCGETLWAYNRRHLAYLQEYVGAKLRDSGAPKRTLGNKLPKWMLLAKNRDDVLKGIERLMTKT